MIQKTFDSVDKPDIDLLVANGVLESRTLEYKQELPGNSDSEKKEFLADISSFANGGGGDILYGVKAKIDSKGQKTGEPDYVAPLSPTPDEAKLRLEEIIRQGIAPRVRLQIKEIIGWGDDGNGFVLLLRIPKSFASPHMVTFKGTSRFFSRNSAGKFQLDVEEIRSAVLATDSQADRIKRFREERLGRIIADEIPVVLESSHRLVLHVIPVASFLNRERLELGNSDGIIAKLPPLGEFGWDHRFNLDGRLTWGKGPGGNADSYCQLFFDGCIESVDSDLLRTAEGKRVNGGFGLIASIAYERNAVSAVKFYMEGYKLLGLDAPFAVSMALLGCRGSYMSVDARQSRGEYHPIDRDAVILPDVVVESYDADIPQVMKPIFDSVWNACGYHGSLNYTQDGRWNVRSI